MQLTFINHACFKVQLPNFTMLVDPWFSGKIFNDSWRLLTETDIKSVDLSQLRYLWISHEHPDHFHFPTLKAIREQANPLVYFQDMPDKSVRDALRKMGFRVAEMRDRRTYEPEAGLQLTCVRCGGDSSLIIKTPQVTVVNTNDCGLDDERLSAIKRIAGSVDYLFAQFGLAGYWGNPEETDKLKAAHDGQVRQLVSYTKYLSPRHVVPFASYVDFCRARNRYVNDVQVRPDELLGLGLPLLLPKPGDAIRPSMASKNADAAEFWTRLIAQQREYPDDAPVPAAALQEQGSRFMREFRDQIHRRRRVNATSVWIPDFERWAIFDWRGYRFYLTSETAASCAGEMTSADLLFFLKFPWGSDTTNISSTFRVYDRELWDDLAFSKHWLYGVKKAPLTTRLKNRVMVAARPLIEATRRTSPKFRL